MSDEGGRFRILGKRVDGSGQDEVLHESATGVWVDDASRGEPLLAIEGTASDGNYKLWLVRLGGDRPAEPFQHGLAGSQTHSDVLARWPPAGLHLRRIAACRRSTSSRSMARPGAGRSSRDGGDLATWRADGRRDLLPSVSTGCCAQPPFGVALRSRSADEEALFPLRIPPLAITSQHAYYMASPDGRRFLVNQAAGAASEPGIQVTLGWSPPPPAGARP